MCGDCRNNATEGELVERLCDAFHFLRSHRWSDRLAEAPAGRVLEFIELGSAGIHRGYRDESGFWVVDTMDIWPAKPALWRLPAAVQQEAGLVS